MAFEKIYLLAEQLRKEILRLEERLSECEDRETRIRLYARQEAYFDCLMWHYDTTLSTARFRHQRDECRRIMEELNPTRAAAYFKTQKPKK